MSTTVTGNRALRIEEPLIFEQDTPGTVGVDLPKPPEVKNRLGGLERRTPIGLPRLSEPQVVRHYMRISRNNYAIDTGFYPLGSCTMKHNPRLGEKMARMPGLGDLHPLQPQTTVQGMLALIDCCAHWLKTLSGMPAIAMSPAAGAHGELTGLMCMRAALEAKGDSRTTILVPESAHGTNPASAHACGFAVKSVPADESGRVDFEALLDKLGPDVAGIMITNPNTCGLFETDMVRISEAVHAAGGYVYCDGANFNALVGKVRPGDLGIDCMHLNLHKTFSTPHGGGGPGSGPVVLSAALAEFAPVPYIINNGNAFRLVEHAGDGASLGRVKGFHGQVGMFIRALAFMASHGADGLRQVAEDAVLNANYLLARLKDVLSPSFAGPCMHECLFDDGFLRETNVTTLDFAKAMIDEGVHPMTMYFPLVVRGALLMEPTETESKQTLDRFVEMIAGLVARAKSGEHAYFTEAPRHAPRRRLDETTAARQPVLRWTPD